MRQYKCEKFKCHSRCGQGKCQHKILNYTFRWTPTSPTIYSSLSRFPCGEQNFNMISSLHHSPVRTITSYYNNNRLVHWTLVKVTLIVGLAANLEENTSQLTAHISWLACIGPPLSTITIATRREGACIGMLISTEGH